MDLESRRGIFASRAVRFQLAPPASPTEKRCRWEANKSPSWIPRNDSQNGDQHRAQAGEGRERLLCHLDSTTGRRLAGHAHPRAIRHQGEANTGLGH